MFRLNFLFYVHELNQIVKDAGPRDRFYGKKCKKRQCYVSLFFTLLAFLAVIF